MGRVAVRRALLGFAVGFFVFVQSSSAETNPIGVSADNQNKDGDLIRLPDSSSLGAASPSIWAASWSLTPAAFLGADFRDRIVNLTSDADTLTLDHFTSGFRVMQIRRLDLGAGAAAGVSFNDVTNFGVTAAGLIPIFGRSVYRERYVAQREDIAKLPKLRLPYDPADLETWHASDKMVFSTRGGISFWGGAGYLGFFVTAGYSVAGEWTTYVEKLPSNRIFVKLSHEVLKSFKTNVGYGCPGTGLTMAALSLGAFREADRGFAFSFDLSNPRAANAYIQMLHGNLQPAQVLAVEGDGSVQHYIDQTTHSRILAAGLKIGVPVLYTYTNTFSHIYSLTESKVYADGSNSELRKGVYLHEHRTRGILSSHAYGMSTFIGAHELRHKKDGQLELLHTGLFKWSYERLRSKDENIEHALRSLGQSTGLSKMLAVVVPDDDKLGYAQVSFTAALSDDSVAHLMKLAVNESAQEQFFEIAWSLMNRYAAGGEDADELCASYPHSLGECMSHMKDHVNHAVVEMIAELRRMALTERSDGEVFAQSFARFGRAFVSNPFVFKSVLFLTKDHPIDLTFDVQGERISRLHKAIDWTNQARLPEILGSRP